MSLNISQRPQGYIIGTTPFTGTVTSSGGALITYASHGLNSNDPIFINSDYSYYNGFWLVTVISTDTFRLKRYIYDGTYQYGGVDCSITFYKIIGTHSFNAVELPIVYRLQSTLFPTNQDDTERNVLTFTNDQGYTRLTLDGDIKTTGSAQTLEFVKGTVNGVSAVYQILNWYSDTSITIDLVYDGGNSFGAFEYYYSNYHAKIRVYAGINLIGSVIKPIELITEFEVYPDEDSFCVFSVNEILKQKIGVLLNDPISLTRPKDIDAFCEFYIEYAESYDQSTDGYTLGTYTSSYTSDSGSSCYAINAKLPFKNRYSGFMSEYLGSSRKFLTTMTAPSLFPGNYFDLAFLMDTAYDAFVIYLRLQRYIGTTLSYTDYNIVTPQDEGVYRMPISQGASEDSIIASLTIQNTPAVEDDSVSQGAAGTTSKTIPYFIRAGSTPTETYTIVCSINAPFDPGDQASGFVRYNYIDGTTNSFASLLRSTQGSSQLGPTALPSPAKDVESITISATIVEAGAANVMSSQVFVSDLQTSHVTISETKTIDVDEDCANQSIYITWKNYLGGHDYWLFTAEKEYGVDILETTQSNKNIFPEWPKSYGEFEDTLEFETSRRSKNTILVRSQNLTLEQVQGLMYIKTSPLVQIMTSDSDRRTVLVDSNSFVVYNETDKLYGIQFTIRYTDDIPSQSL